MVRPFGPGQDPRRELSAMIRESFNISERYIIDLQCIFHMRSIPCVALCCRRFTYCFLNISFAKTLVPSGFSPELVAPRWVQECPVPLGQRKKCGTGSGGRPWWLPRRRERLCTLWGARCRAKDFCGTRVPNCHRDLRRSLLRPVVKVSLLGWESGLRRIGIVATSFGNACWAQRDKRRR